MKNKYTSNFIVTYFVKLRLFYYNGSMSMDGSQIENRAVTGAIKKVDKTIDSSNYS